MLAGCTGTPAGPTALEPTASPALTPWERGLAANATTPDLAPRRTAEERRADVAPPGAPPFAAFDALMAQFMASHEIPAANVAVLRNGQLRYEQGYGFLDEARSKATPPDALFRIASITKPMTAAVMQMLVDQGLLGWDDKAFCLPPTPAPDCRLPIAPHPARPVADHRLADVTLAHLRDHLTGWTRGPCTDPFWAETPLRIAEQFGIPSPPPAWRTAQWFLGTPMEFDPGTDPGPTFDTYCNMGYILLGLVAEARTGVGLGALYQAYIFEPLEVAGDIEPGHTLPELRNPREPFYACDGGPRQSIFDPSKEVCAADGAFDLDGILAAGGLISTPAATGAIYEVFGNRGAVRDPSRVSFNSHSGGLPGTATTAFRQGTPLGDVQIVVFFNKSTGPQVAGFDVGFPYEYQTLHANLLGAFAAAEGALPV